MPEYVNFTYCSIDHTHISVSMDTHCQLICSTCVNKLWPSNINFSEFSATFPSKTKPVTVRLNHVLNNYPSRTSQKYPHPPSTMHTCIPALRHSFLPHVFRDSLTPHIFRHSLTPPHIQTLTRAPTNSDTHSHPTYSNTHRPLLLS
jgi:hypothetical protein